MGKKVLIVEDSTSMRTLISFTLQGAGFDVIEAEDGKDAINKTIKEEKIDLVISDLNMPNMNGIELLKYFRADDLFKFVPIVMLTTESEVEKVMEAKKAGVSGWIVKPFNPAKLVEVAKKFLK